MLYLQNKISGNIEHDPHRCSGNKYSVKTYKLEDIIWKDAPIWKRGKIPYKQLQKGFGSYSLYETCNNITGSWYAAAYCDVSHIIRSIIIENKVKSGRFIDVALPIKSLNFLKQVLSMFCTSNGQPPNDLIKDLILNKELSAKSLGDIKIFMVANVGAVHHTSGAMMKMQFDMKAGNFTGISDLSDIMYFRLCHGI